MAFGAVIPGRTRPNHRCMLQTARVDKAEKELTALGNKNLQM